jgi:MFS family permease
MTPSDDIRSQAKRYQLVVARSGRGHYIAAERAEARGRLLGVISASLGAIVGTSIFATLQETPTIGWRIAAGLLTTIAAVLTALLTFLDYAKRAAEHRSAGAAYGRLRREFDAFFLELGTISDRGESLGRLSDLRTRIDDLGESSPLIPRRSYKTGLTQVGQGGDLRAAASVDSVDVRQDV